MQRLTQPGNLAIERLDFTTPEAELCVKSVAYFARTSTQILEANWDNQGLRAILDSPSEATAGTERMLQLMGYLSQLGTKFVPETGETAVAIDLSLEEIDTIGVSLYRLGNSGLKHAVGALRNGTVVPGNGEAGRIEMEHRAQAVAVQTFDLYKQIEPIALDSETVMWLKWDSPLQSITESRTQAL